MEGKLKREDIFLTTKLPLIGIHPDRVEMFMKKSLKNLGMEYVDLYLVHFPIGCKYKGDCLYKPINEKGEVELEEATDICAVWKVKIRI